MSKVTLNDVVNLIDTNTAAATINANYATIEAGFDNTLSRDGTAPNTMSAAIDMNSNQIYNLPAPSTVNSPARLIDVVSNPTISIPGQGTSGHVVPFLDGNNTWSGTNTHSAAISTSGGATLSGTTMSGLTNLSSTAISVTNLSVATSLTSPSITVSNNSPNALTLTGSSSNSIGFSIANSIASGHTWGIYSSGGGPSALGSLVIYDNTSGGARLIVGTDGAVTLNSTTASTSSTTGALIVAGGVGISGAVYVNGTVNPLNLISSGYLVSSNPTNGVGYTTGAGGTVTQTTSRTTGVTLNKICGAITLVSAAGTTAYQKFTVTNSTVAATDTIIVNQKSGTDRYAIFVTAIGTGSFDISYATLSGTTVEQPVFNFTVLKAVTA